MIAYVIINIGLATGQITPITPPTPSEPSHTAVVVLPRIGMPPSMPRLPTQPDKASTTTSAVTQQDNSEAANSASTDKEPHSGENGFADFIKPKREDGGFLYRFYKAYHEQFFPPKKENGAEEPEKPRRALPSPWDAPPFPTSEYQGYPLIGVP